jgi:Domain of unknown function (DUF397)
VTWRRSTYRCGANVGCVEVCGFAGVVSVRDSKNPQSPLLVFTREAFGELLERVKKEDPFLSFTDGGAK